jgi:mono/diheme cytochrome c family protein
MAILGLVLTSVALAQDAKPRLLGLGGDHGLEPAQVGRILLSELNCGACHGDASPRRIVAPDLTDIGRRVTPEHLWTTIAFGHKGGRAPDVFGFSLMDHGGDDGFSIAQYLISLSQDEFVEEPLDPDLAARGLVLFNSVGCVACHAPRGDQLETPGLDVDLTGVRRKYSRSSLAEFLLQPTKHRPAGLMPDMGLDRGEADAIANELLRGGRGQTIKVEDNDIQIEFGRQLFLRRGCVACHPLSGLDAAPRQVALEGANLSQGCLTNVDRSFISSPDFDFAVDERAAIRAALAPDAPQPTPKQRLAEDLVRFNCIACHQRDDYGGVPRSIDSFFKTDSFELGDQVRIPPELTGVGSKLTPDWLERVLLDGASVRDYMHTRMPRFGEDNIGHLPALFAEIDGIDSTAFTPPEGETRNAYRDAGRDLLGNRGLACVMCHDFNSKPAPVHRGIDLINTPERLQPGWFQRFLIDPTGTRPGIVMPESWTDGIAAHQGILDGDTQKQIEALWYYLTLGTSAGDPPGIRAEPTQLLVTDKPRLYRGRSRIAGFRGIAVGLPGGLSYAFNAQTGALTGLWTGDFLNVRWDGQGAGDFRPAGKPIELAQDVAFHRLEKDIDPWPLKPVMTEEEPVNPDPLYPKNLGYQFEGYFLNESDLPTLMYRSGGVKIQDTSEPYIIDGRTVLKRTLEFTSKEAETLHMRALTGHIEQPDSGGFRSGDITFTGHGVINMLRPAAKKSDGQDLILVLEIPKGTYTIRIDYELHR